MMEKFAAASGDMHASFLNTKRNSHNAVGYPIQV
jgi:hypothetical protein